MENYKGYDVEVVGIDDNWDMVRINRDGRYVSHFGVLKGDNTTSKIHYAIDSDLAKNNL